MRAEHDSGPTIRVLHAEDDDAFRELVATALGREADIEVVSAATPAAACSRLREERFDCVLSDYDGPEESGAFLPVIEMSGESVPCILLTGAERTAVDPAAIEAGVDDYVRKGAMTGQFDLLADRVRNHVERYRSRHRYRALFEEGAGPMTVHRADTGELVDVNQQFADHMGYSREEAAELTMADLCPDDDPEYTLETAHRYLERAANGDQQRFEWVTPTVDGDRVPVEVTLKRMDVAGEARILATVQDITDRWEREAELDAYRQNLEQLHRAARDILASESRAAVVEGVVDAAMDVFEADACSIGLPDDDGLRLVAARGETANARRRCSLANEARAQRKTAIDGDTLAVPLASHGVFVVEGTESTAGDPMELAEILTSHATVALDRADREAELTASHQRMASLSAAFPDYAFLYDVTGTVIDRLLSPESDGDSAELEDVTGKTLDHVLASEDAAAVRETMRRAVETGAVQSVEYPIETLDGIRWYEARIAPLPSVDGPKVVLVARDTTTRKAYEEQLERQNDRLDEFASLVSHDLRNPLNVIHGRLDLLQAAATQKSVQEHASAALSAAERMDGLIGDLLTLARTDEYDITPEVVPLTDVVSQAWATVPGSRAALDHPDDVTIHADAGELVRLFENLFRNAVEHGSVADRPTADGPDVTVTIEAAGDTLTIADDGPGIPPENRDVIFESGFSTSRDGTGYGLDIVRRIARGHGWTVCVGESADGGARFDIEGVTLGVVPAHDL